MKHILSMGILYYYSIKIAKMQEVFVNLFAVSLCAASRRRYAPPLGQGGEEGEENFGV